MLGPALKEILVSGSNMVDCVCQSELVHFLEIWGVLFHHTINMVVEIHLGHRAHLGCIQALLKFDGRVEYLPDTAKGLEELSHLLLGVVYTVLYSSVHGGHDHPSFRSTYILYAYVTYNIWACDFLRRKSCGRRGVPSSLLVAEANNPPADGHGRVCPPL